MKKQVVCKILLWNNYKNYANDIPVVERLHWKILKGNNPGLLHLLWPREKCSRLLLNGIKITGKIFAIITLAWWKCNSYIIFMTGSVIIFLKSVFYDFHFCYCQCFYFCGKYSFHINIVVVNIMLLLLLLLLLFMY